MTRILFSETAFDRLGFRLATFAGLECLVMDMHGTVRLDGVEIPRAEAGPECALISHDAFFDAGFIELLRDSAALEWVQSTGAGVDHPTFVMLAEKGVRLTTYHGQSVGMAEYVMWGVLDHFQAGKTLTAEQGAHRWTKRRAREINGTLWLIIGFGTIGEAVAQRAKAFDAHVTGVRRRPRQSPFADAMTTPDRLSEHLGDSDVVVLCAPQTPETVNMVDADFLAAMKPGSMLVNVGRGSMIDEGALLAALDAGTPEHALLDVFRTEPLSADSRFWDHPSVTVTPHTSAISSRVVERADDLFLENLARYLVRAPLLNEISAGDVLASRVT